MNHWDSGLYKCSAELLHLSDRSGQQTEATMTTLLLLVAALLARCSSLPLPTEDNQLLAEVSARETRLWCVRQMPPP